MPLAGSVSLHILCFTFKMRVVLIADYLLMASSKQRLIIYTLAFLKIPKTLQLHLMRRSNGGVNRDFLFTQTIKKVGV